MILGFVVASPLQVLDTVSNGAGTDVKTGASPGTRTLERIFDQSAHILNQLSLPVPGPPERIHETSSYGLSYRDINERHDISTGEGRNSHRFIRFHQNSGTEEHRDQMLSSGSGSGRNLKSHGSETPSWCVWLIFDAFYPLDEHMFQLHTGPMWACQYNQIITVRYLVRPTCRDGVGVAGMWD